MHYTRVKRHGSPDKVIAPADRKVQRGNEHYSWNADPDYRQWHQRLRKIKGSASNHSCSMGCGRQAAQWAYVGVRHADQRSAYEVDPDMYVPLCSKCHIHLDAAHRGPVSRPRLSQRGWRAQARELYDSGLGTVEIGRIVERHPVTVYRALVRDGVEMRPQVGGKKKQ